MFTQILLLDEPTAGMDPCSRHIVWNLLKYRKANRVTLFSTHFMDEADILAGEIFALRLNDKVTSLKGDKYGNAKSRGINNYLMVYILNKKIFKN